MWHKKIIDLTPAKCTESKKTMTADRGREKIVTSKRNQGIGGKKGEVD